jgi:hypothetical protein
LVIGFRFRHGDRVDFNGTPLTTGRIDGLGGRGTSDMAESPALHRRASETSSVIHHPRLLLPHQ